MREFKKVIRADTRQKSLGLSSIVSALIILEPRFTTHPIYYRLMPY